MLTEENQDRRPTLEHNVSQLTMLNNDQTPLHNTLPGLQSALTLATGIGENLSVMGAKMDGGTGGVAQDSPLYKKDESFEGSTAGCCRICLSEEEEDNPLICPCKCAGSMGQIHVECLRSWLNSKR